MFAVQIHVFSTKIRDFPDVVNNKGHRDPIFLTYLTSQTFGCDHQKDIEIQGENDAPDHNDSLSQWQ